MGPNPDGDLQLAHHTATPRVIVISSDLQELARCLLDCFRDGNCIAWVGSGLTMENDYPDWPTAVCRLCEACAVCPPDQHGALTADILLDKAQECKVKNLSAYQRTLAGLYGPKAYKPRMAVHHLMRLPFRGYITTNFDPLLVQVAETHDYCKWLTYPSLPPEPLADSHPIYHIHGRARDDDKETGDNLILARSDFDAAYGEGGAVRRFLEHVFAYYHVLFLGCRLSEPAMSEVFTCVHDMHRLIEEKLGCRPDVRRYILVPESRLIVNEAVAAREDIARINEAIAERAKADRRQEEARWRDMGIEPYWYSPRDRDHREVDDFLEYLCRRWGLSASQLQVDLVERAFT